MIVGFPLADVADSFAAFLAHAAAEEMITEHAVDRVGPNSFQETQVQEGLIDQLGDLFPEYLAEWSTIVTRYDLAAHAAGTEVTMTLTLPDTLDVALRILGATIDEPDLANPFPSEAVRDLRRELTQFVRQQIATKQQPQRPGMDIQ